MLLLISLWRELWRELKIRTHVSAVYTFSKCFCPLLKRYGGRGGLPLHVRLAAERAPSLVLDANQKKSSGGRRWAGRNHRAGSEAGFEARAIQISFAGFQQHAHNVPHHVLQEAAAPNAVDQLLARSLEARRKDAADFGSTQLICIVGGGERGEIMFAFDQRGQLGHARFVQRIRMVMNVDAQTEGTLPRAIGGIRRSWRGRDSAGGNQARLR